MKKAHQQLQIDSISNYGATVDASIRAYFVYFFWWHDYHAIDKKPHGKSGRYRY